MAFIELTQKEIEDFIGKFYNFFKTGYDFEVFLKEYLKKQGFIEINVTKPSNDKGVDLTAIKQGLGEDDSTTYIVQAKRFKKGSNVGAPIVQQCRGAAKTGEKPVVITTSSFTKQAIEEAKENGKVPVLLIDGKTLIEKCIELGIGVAYKPVFSSAEMKNAVDSAKGIQKSESSSSSSSSSSTMTYIAEKLITSNDIKARIISLPSGVTAKISAGTSKIKIKCGTLPETECSYNEKRKFVSGVTKVLGELGARDASNSIIPTNVEWYIENDTFVIKKK